MIRQVEYALAEKDWSGTSELIVAHRLLHTQFGDDPPDLVLDIEKDLSTELRRRGIEHRYDDALTEKAGTKPATLRPPTSYEVQSYLKPIALDSDAVRLVMDASGVHDSVYVDVQGNLLSSLEKPILKAMNRLLPPGLQLRPLTRGVKGDFAQVTTVYALRLECDGLMPGTRVTTWQNAVQRLRDSAAKASQVFKADMDPRIPFRVLKTAAEDAGEYMEGLVTGVILEPNVIDKTTTDESEGDIYSEEEITKAMFWWMENAGHTFTDMHLDHGGTVLSEDEVVLLENWQTREDGKLGEQDVPKGTWCASVRVRNADLLQRIRGGKVNSWSIGANAMAALERVAA